MASFARAAGLAFPVLVVAAVAALLARAAGTDVHVSLLVLAALWLALAVLLAAGLATLALARREWWWAAAMIVAWPVALPLYVRRLARDRRSKEPDV